MVTDIKSINCSMYTACPSAPVASPVNNFDESSSGVPNYPSPTNK